ncbi:saccharopine dehydrogenase NADP-binding domain-containing protein [Lysinibacillus sp. CNPSo 3705]|uniref:saccharopine dehydrogenase NADP-binding domain-containing protein n=1 Tax=Lysinibacillus sp. CNPSo 3705 TaxID=3028148 RepID=UPI002363D0E6|nr:saccharopine dehydrogenase NADP-binding domain-containing protein [Lysinibacillus sp. CNPSo 3705]MDD1502752.1 saccharopine dehydrogenase NADP-binding domain-containing protein [Lysinibacillus sp. CNPSo 3705]
MNHQFKIGIIGYNGAVGQAAVRYLKDKYPLRCGSRSEHKEHSQLDKFMEYMQVDIYDQIALETFCAGCTIVLNCAGPSYSIIDRVAQAAIKAGAHYVDAFGADLLEKKFMQQELTNIMILSAGSYPGLSGILPRLLAQEGFDQIDKISGYAGGEEVYSKGAAADIMLSSIYGFGTANAFYKDEKIVRDIAQTEKINVTINGEENTVYAQSYLTNETILLAKKLHIKEAHWHNIYPNKAVFSLLQQACIQLAMKNTPEHLHQIVDDLMEKLILYPVRQTWYTLVIEMIGKYKGQSIRRQAQLLCQNSFTISGIICALSVEAIIEGIVQENRVYWAYDILNPSNVMRELHEQRVIEDFIITSQTENHAGLEVGIL